MIESWYGSQSVRFPPSLTHAAAAAARATDGVNLVNEDDGRGHRAGADG
jgi:hypothetical protein